MRLREVQQGRGGLAGGAARVGLTVLSWGYRAGLAGAGLLRAVGVGRAKRLPVRVVSIGNLTAGGTGKTPFVAWLAAAARSRGRRPGVLSRGYGPKPEGATVSDEGAVLLDLLALLVPLAEDPDRIAGANRLLAEEPPPDVLLLDDGFQHRRVARDVDVVLVDATAPFRGARLLPRGMLREPLRALRRAHAVVLTRTESADPAVVDALAADVARIAPRALIARAIHEPTGLVATTGVTEPADALRGVSVFLHAGIGNPEAFEATVAGLGARILGRRFDADHVALRPRDAMELVAAFRATGAERLVTTYKDFVKWRALAAPPPGIVALHVRLEVLEGADALLELCVPRP